MQIHDRLVQMAIYYPVTDQKDGSYMTITSDSGIQFMFIFFLSGLSQMLVDQSFWQSAIAAKPTAAAKVSSNALHLALPALDTLCKCLPVMAQGFRDALVLISVFCSSDMVSSSCHL